MWKLGLYNSYLLVIICILRTSIDYHSEDFTLHRSRSSRYPALTITNAELADDLEYFADICSDAEKLSKYQNTGYF